MRRFVTTGRRIHLQGSKKKRRGRRKKTSYNQHTYLHNLLKMQSLLKGLIAAPFTPMDAHGELDLSKINDYYTLLKRNKVTGAFIAGSTGEGVSLTMEEKEALTDAWADATRDDLEFHVIVLVGGTCLKDCIRLAKHATRAGIYGVAFTAPSYFKPANAAILAELCRKIAGSIPDTPFYYYHIPVLTGCQVTMFDLLTAINGSIPNLCGIKYTHEDFMDFQSCMVLNGGRYNMLWGRDENMLPALALQTKAAVGSTYNYAAPLYHQLMEAYSAGDHDKAVKLQQQSIDMIRLLGRYGGIATGKAFMKLIGLDCGNFRLPIGGMDEKTFEQFKQDTDRVGFPDFRSI